MPESVSLTAERVDLIAASCTTGWFDGEHGNLWLAPDGIARVPLGWGVSFVHSFQGIDPAIWRRETTTRDELARALMSSPRVLWLPSGDMEGAWLHSGILCDRVSVRTKNGMSHKLLWVRSKRGTSRLRDALRNWLGPRLVID
jgi:hypothetical protein